MAFFSSHPNSQETLAAQREQDLLRRAARANLAKIANEAATEIDHSLPQHPGVLVRLLRRAWGPMPVR